MRIPIIANRSARQGGARSELDTLEAEFRNAGVEPEIIQMREGEDICELARRVADKAPAAMVAAGGDGTVNAVASAVAGSDIPLGVVALGTLNHFAKDLSLPLDIAGAARVIAGGHTAAVDVGTVNGRVFVNNSSLGLYPHIVRERESQRRRLGRGKWNALLWATWMTLRRSPFMNLRLSLDGKEALYRASFVFIGNNRYTMEGFEIGQRAALDGGVLSLYASARRGRLGLFLLALRAMAQRLHQADDFEALTAHRIVIESRRRRLHVATDGEVVYMDTPLEYSIRPRALRVFTPAPAAT